MILKAFKKAYITIKRIGRLTYPCMSIDRICLGNSTAQWLKSKNVLPSQWGLNLDRQDLILTSGITLLAFNSPGCTYLVPQPSGVLANAKAIVLFDTYVLEDAGLSSDEIIAMLLHEIGHNVHRPPKNFYNQNSIHLGSNADEELFADDLVRHWGRGLHLSACISRLASFDKTRFESLLTQERLRRIKDDDAYLTTIPI